MDAAADCPHEQHAEGSRIATQQRSLPARPRRAPGDTGHVSDEEEPGNPHAAENNAGKHTWSLDGSWASSWAVSLFVSRKESNVCSVGLGSYTMGNVKSRNVRVGEKTYRNSFHALQWFFPTRLLAVCLSMGAAAAVLSQVFSAAAFNILVAEVQSLECSTDIASVWFSDVTLAYAIEVVVYSLLNVQILIPAFIHQRHVKDESYGVLARALFSMTLCLLLACCVGTFGIKNASGGLRISMFALWSVLWCAGPVLCAYFHMRPAEEYTGFSREHKFLVLSVVLTVIGVTAYVAGFRFSSFITSFVLAVLGVNLILGWRRNPGQRGFSARVMLGYANCQLASTSLIRWSTLARELGTGPTLVLWVAMCLVGKTFVSTLAENCVPNAWVACATLPYCVIEDLIPILIFGTSGDLNVEFWVSSGALCLWEIVRDSPRLKERVIGAVKAIITFLNPCQRCVSVCKRTSGDCGPMPALGCVTLATFFGGGMAAEIVEEAADGVAEEAAEAQRGKIAMKFDIARCNMVSELCCASLVFVVVLTTHFQDEHQIFSPAVVMVCFAMQAFSVIVATVINIRSLQKMQVALAQWGVSRFALACAGAHMAGMVGLMMYTQFKLRVQDELSQCKQ